MTNCACTSLVSLSLPVLGSLSKGPLPSSGKFLKRSLCRNVLALSSSVRSAVFLGWVKNLWKTLKFTPDIHTARDCSMEALSTPLCCMFCHSLAGSSSGCGSGSVGSGWPGSIRSGSVCLGPCSAASVVGVDEVASLTARLGRFRFNVALAPFTGVSLGASGAGAASSRARALVDRRGSDMVLMASMFRSTDDARDEASALRT